MPDSTQLCDCAKDPGLCIASMIAPGIVVSQLVQRTTGTGFCSILTVLVVFQSLAFIFFMAAEEELVKTWAAAFHAISCKYPTFSDVTGLPNGLPNWMEDSRNDEVKAGQIFPCSTYFDDDGEIAGWYDIEGIVIMILNILGGLCEIATVIAFLVAIIKVRSALRSKNQAGGNGCMDCLCACCCWSCFLSQTARSAGISGKTYSFTAIDAEIGVPLASGTTATKDVPIAAAAVQLS